MAKKKIGEFRGHPIVTGNIHEKEAHEIHISQIFNKDNEKPSEPTPGLPEDYEVASTADIDELAAAILSV